MRNTLSYLYVYLIYFEPFIYVNRDLTACLSLIYGYIVRINIIHPMFYQTHMQRGAQMEKFRRIYTLLSHPQGTNVENR